MKATAVAAAVTGCPGLVRRLLLLIISGAAPLRSLRSDNPGNGIVNYDNFLFAMYNVLVVTTMANWTDQMFPLWDATSSAVAVYYISLIICGAFFAVNIFLVRADCVCTRQACLMPCLVTTASLAVWPPLVCTGCAGVKLRGHCARRRDGDRGHGGHSAGL